MSDAVVLHRLLRRHRRRWATVRTVVQLARVTVLAVAVSGVWLLLLPARPLSSPQTTTLAIVVTGLVAVAMWWAVPDVSATARAIDRRAGLDDRLATALQVARDDDPVARLIVRDAATRLRRLRPTRVFPFEAPTHGRVWLSAGVLLAAGLLAHAFPSGALAPRAGGMWMTDASAGGAPPPDTGRPSPRDVPQTQARAPSGSLVPTATPGVEAAGAASRTTAGSGAVPPPANPPGRAAAAPQAATASAADTESASRQASRLTADAAGRTGMPGTSPGSTTKGGASSVADGVLDGAAGPGVTAAGSTAGAGATTAAAGGGVRSGSLAAVGPPAARVPAPGSAAYADRYREASRRADAALADERVPVRLRAHVRAYFAAIRPPVQP